MNWIKNVILDIAVTGVITIWVFTGPEWAYWVILIYTPLLLLLKLTTVSSGLSKVAALAGDATPNWFYHLIYAANLILLLVGEWWVVAGGWAIIWVLSVVQESKKASYKTSSKKPEWKSNKSTG